MNNPEEFVERATRFLKQQRALYGDFAVQLSENSEEAADKLGEADTPETASEANTEQLSPSVENKEEQPEIELTTEQRIAACTTLDELRALCEQAEELRTDLEGTNLVFGVGNASADVMIIGEAPGFNEDKQGEPFVGQAGQLLDKIMKAIQFTREDIYITNILKHRPPDNRDPKAEESQRSLPYLLRQIELIDPKLILCVGRISATILLNGNTSLKNLRQKFHSFHGRELMATYHPAALLRNQQWKRPTWDDVQMLRKRYDELVGEE